MSRTFYVSQLKKLIPIFMSSVSLFLVSASGFAGGTQNGQFQAPGQRMPIESLQNHPNSQGHGPQLSPAASGME